MYKFLLLSTSLGWGVIYWFISDSSNIQKFLVATLGAVSVGYLHYIIFSIYYSKKNKEHKSVQSLHEGLLEDLFNPMSTGMVLFCIFYFTDQSYSKNSIDIASFAIGFFTSSLQQVWSTFNTKVAGKKLRKSAIFWCLFVVLILFSASAYSFILVYTEDYSLVQGTWVQITATLVSFYAYVESRRMKSVFDGGGYIHVSNGMLEFFRFLDHHPTMVLALKEAAERKNKQTKINKAKNSAKKRRK